MSSAAVMISALRVKNGGERENSQVVSPKSLPIRLKAWRFFLIVKVLLKRKLWTDKWISCKQMTKVAECGWDVF